MFIDQQMIPREHGDILKSFLMGFSVYKPSIVVSMLYRRGFSKEFLLARDF